MELRTNKWLPDSNSDTIQSIIVMPVLDFPSQFFLLTKKCIIQIGLSYPYSRNPPFLPLSISSRRGGSATKMLG